VLKVLFVCTHNACRSILAEVILRYHAGTLVDTASAGSAPGTTVHPLTISHLEQAGYATTGLASKGYAEVEDFNPDVVITVCDRAAGEACPLWLGDTPRVHWGLPDPSHLPGSDSERSAAFRRAMQTLERRAKALGVRARPDMNANEMIDIMNELAELT
jgi:arsenate reductase